MKKIILFVICVFLLCGCENKKIETSNILATSYVVIEQSTNKVLEGYNYNESRSVASISKIMTAIIAIENSDVNKTIKVPKEINNVTGSSVYLCVDQEITILDLLYALLLRSGNDAAISLAISTCNSVDAFVDKMNEKAKEIKLNNTFFSNPHGLDENDSGNISSALDMALLYSYCMENPLFKQIVSTKTYKTYTNKNKLLKTYMYCTGGKTGFTKKAKRTLITSASKNDINLIIVTLNCGNDFNEHKNKYEYYFNNFEAIKILNKGNNYFDNCCIKISKDYYFITDQKDLSLHYYISLNERKIKITLYDNKKNVLDFIQVTY